MQQPTGKPLKVYFYFVYNYMYVSGSYHTPVHVHVHVCTSHLYNILVAECISTPILITYACREGGGGGGGNTISLRHVLPVI